MSEPSDNTMSSRESTPKLRFRTPDNIVSSSASDQSAQEEYMPKVVKLSKSKGADALDRYFSEDADGMYFHNSKDALNAMNHAQWHPPAEDDTIPQDDEQDRCIVRRLVDAFLDTGSAMDTEGNAYRKRLTPGTNVFYDPWTIERCAWEILHLVKSMHNDGFKAPILDIDILKAIGQTELWTFEDRIVMICRVLKISKSVAVSLMKHEKVWTTIGAPHKLYNSTVVNTQSNAFRNKWVKAGRAAEKGNTTASDDTSSDPPAKKRKRTSTKAPNKGSVTFTPSPLASTVSSTTTATTSSTSHSNNNRNENTDSAASLSSISPDKSVNKDVDMVDAETDGALEEKIVRDKLGAQGESNSKTRLSIKTKKTNSSSATPPALGEEDTNDVTMADAHTSKPASAARAPADIDAAEMLLGLRAA